MTGVGQQAAFRCVGEDSIERHGFNWLRVWATWDMFDHDVSAVGDDGAPREPFVRKLQWLVAEAGILARQDRSLRLR